jgi:imidazolonepropionase-like amidohydrolase
MTRLILCHTNLLDGDHAAQKDATVIIEGDRIVAVGSSDSIEIGPDERATDLSGLTLMPGMVSGHFHGVYENQGAKPEEVPSGYMSVASEAYLALRNAQTALHCGFTSVVSAGTHYDIDVQLAAAIDAGQVIGPRVIPGSRTFFPAAQPIEGADQNDCYCWLHGPDAFRRAVARDVERGAKVIKIFASGGHGFDPGRDMTAAEIEAVVETAHEGGARVRAHLAGRDPVLASARMGVDIIDHADGADRTCIDAFLEHGSFVLPSVYLLLRAFEMGGNNYGFEDLTEFEAMCKTLPEMAAAGVKLAAGDDFGVWQMPHGSYAEELVCYAEHADVTPLEVLRWATRYGGELTGIPDLGTIAPGMLADLVIVDGDPSTDLSVLTVPERIKAVLKGGEVLSGTLPEAAIHPGR